MTAIKICGIRRSQDVSYLNKIKPEYAGMVFWDRSKRNLSFEEARELRRELSPDIQTVGVFVDREIEDIVYLTNEGIISLVQLHGSEDESVISRLRQECKEGTVIIKAFEVSSREDIIKANASSADIVLIDSGKGSGVTFDWDMLREINRDYFLAGGLSSENVADAVIRLHPFAVDVSSKVETDGYKDFDKINDFCEAVRCAGRR